MTAPNYWPKSKAEAVEEKVTKGTIPDAQVEAALAEIMEHRRWWRAILRWLADWPRPTWFLIDSDWERFANASSKRAAKRIAEEYNASGETAEDHATIEFEGWWRPSEVDALPED